jgi:hypothetical protein
MAFATVAVPAVQVLSSPPASAREPGSLSAQASSTWQSNATVWKMAYGAGDIWMVGDFTNLRPPGAAEGTNTRPATYFAALKASTGAPDPNVDDTHLFAGQSSGQPLTTGAVAVSPDEKTVYVGGNFTTVDGQPRNHIAAFSTATGALLAWNPNVSGPVRTIATYGNVVYIGGGFGRVGNTTVGYSLAAIDASTGAALSWGPGSGPSTDNTVDALAVSSDGSQVVIGGFFSHVDGLSADGATVYNKAAILGGVGSASAGLPEPMPADALAVPPGTDKAPVDGCTSDVKDVVISGPVAYISNEGTGIGCFDGTWAVRLQTGSLNWVNRCLGATQTLAVVGYYLYKGSHEHNCRAANVNGDPNNFGALRRGQDRHLTSESLSNGFLGPWYPVMNGGADLGPRAMATDGSQLYVGGDFTRINGVLQEGITRFTSTTDYPTPTPDAPRVTSTGTGTVVVTATPPVDPDDPGLLMELFRDGQAQPVATAGVESLFWRQPKVRWVLKGLPGGETEKYRVRAVEHYGTGVSPLSPATQVTVACGSSRGVRAAIVRAGVDRGARHEWQVKLEVCSANANRMQFQVRRNSKVLASTTVSHLRPGSRTTLLTLRKSLPSGVIQAYVVFWRASAHLTADRRLRVPR